MAVRKAVEETEEKVVEEVKETPTTKNKLSYAELLEARAQRGGMTHQKKLAIAALQAKEEE
ncbi:hypothetical protein BG262_02850 [Floricoccus penangensis]|uniref:Uncharacterized protein n=1 Tax=Floricoccus penangensis TaxID=1859475 RepID=A0A9Q5JG65_9LACT|nr:hypothetical protein [Floricoccus penangensis]OFI46753.1 hypothetical protein BG262_02850 [Floricoccus penangensis]